MRADDEALRRDPGRDHAPQARALGQILDGEPATRAIGRRPRDPEKEALLLRLDRARLERRAQAGSIESRRATKDEPEG